MLWNSLCFCVGLVMLLIMLSRLNWFCGICLRVGLVV